MVWGCAECNDSTRPVDEACHHCGKLLCQDHAIPLPADPAFAVYEGESRLAYHCAGCHAEHHQRTIGSVGV